MGLLVGAVNLSDRGHRKNEQPDERRPYAGGNIIILDNAGLREQTSSSLYTYTAT